MSPLVRVIIAQTSALCPIPSEYFVHHIKTGAFAYGVRLAKGIFPYLS